MSILQADIQRGPNTMDCHVSGLMEVWIPDPAKLQSFSGPRRCSVFSYAQHSPFGRPEGEQQWFFPAVGPGGTAS